MQTNIKNWLTVPGYTNPEEQRKANLLHIILISLIVLLILNSTLSIE